MNILIIEDDIVWQTQLQLMLEELPSVQLIFAATKACRLSCFKPLTERTPLFL